MSIRGRRTSEHDNSKLTKSSSFSRLERNGPVFGPLKYSLPSQVVEKLVQLARCADFVTQQRSNSERQTNIDFGPSYTIALKGN